MEPYRFVIPYVYLFLIFSFYIFPRQPIDVLSGARSFLFHMFIYLFGICHFRYFPYKKRLVGLDRLHRLRAL